MKLNKQILKALFETKIGSINESYATVKDRFIRDGADKLEVKSLLDLHKKLKDMRRLKDNEINIDVLAKGKSFDEFKSLMSRYSEKDTATKTDKFNKLKNKIVAVNDEYTVYKIDTAEEAYLFHGLTNWCIVSGSKSDAERHFDHYVFRKSSNFYFIVRKKPINDKWDYIALQLRKTEKIYWDKTDYSHRTLPKDLNVPELNVKYEPAVRTVPNSWKLNSDGTYNVNGDVDLEQFKQFVGPDGKLTVKFNKVTGNFVCNNLGLTSLEGCPEKVGGNFDCGFNNLTSLEGAPKEVSGDFECQYNSLTSFKGAPEEVGENFFCSNNKLVSLEGCPEKVGGVFYFENNKGKRFTKSDVERVCKIKHENIYV